MEPEIPKEWEEQASMYGQILGKKIMINNEIDSIIDVHVKRGEYGYPVQIQLGGTKPNYEGWETLKDIKLHDQIAIPI